MSALRMWLRQERARDYAQWLAANPWPPRPPGKPVWRTERTLWFRAEPGWPPYHLLREPTADRVFRERVYIGTWREEQ